VLSSGKAKLYPKIWRYHYELSELRYEEMNGEHEIDIEAIAVLDKLAGRSRGIAMWKDKQDLVKAITEEFSRGYPPPTSRGSPVKDPRTPELEARKQIWQSWHKYDGENWVPDLSGIHILLAAYDIDGYEGSAFVLFEKDGKLYEVNGGHCSCYGLEGQWEPEETSVEGIKLRMQSGYGLLSKLEVLEQLNNIFGSLEKGLAT
jgi:hypothetical protein